MMLFLLPIIDYDLIFLVVYVASLSFGAYLVKKVNTRAGLIAVGIQLSVLKIALFFLLSAFSQVETFGCLKSGEWYCQINFRNDNNSSLPYFEKTFNILTLLNY